MISFFRVHWNDSDGDPEHTDLLEARWFLEEAKGRKIVHRFLKLRERGSFSVAKCNLTTSGNWAELKYEQDHKGRWWPGTTRIVFSDDQRQSIRSVSWADEGSTNFNGHPTFDKIVDQQAKDEVERLKRLGKIATRPEQPEFRAKLRVAYQDRCAITGCTVAQALEAAHIRVRRGKDDNGIRNGILLRADIHALFDAGLLTLTRDGWGIELGAELTGDLHYEFLQGVQIYKPEYGGPSEENIAHHRQRFLFD